MCENSSKQTICVFFLNKYKYSNSYKKQDYINKKTQNMTKKTAQNEECNIRVRI